MCMCVYCIICVCVCPEICDSVTLKLLILVNVESIMEFERHSVHSAYFVHTSFYNSFFKRVFVSRIVVLPLPLQIGIRRIKKQ